VYQGLLIQGWAVPKRKVHWTGGRLRLCCGGSSVFLPLALLAFFIFTKYKKNNKAQVSGFQFGVKC
jgi:F0F1-type ATP synthase assembly protein I